MNRLFTLLLVLGLLTPGSLLAQKPAPPRDRKDDDPPEKKDKEPPAKIAGRTVHEWIKDLQHTDPSVRRDAIQVLPFFGKYSAEAVPQLTWIINNDLDITLRINAAIVLMHLEVHDRDVAGVVRALVAQLSSYQLTLRYHAIVTLGRFGPDATAAIPALQTATADRSSWELRQAACHALYRIGNDPKKGMDQRVIPTLITATSDSASKVRLEAVMGLATAGYIQNTELRLRMLGSLRQRLADRERAIVVWAYFGLMVNDKLNKAYMQELVKYLQRGDVPTKVQVIRAFGMLRREAQPVVKHLVEALKDEDPFVMAAACNTLAELSQHLGLGDAAVDNMKAIVEDKKLEKSNPGLKQLAQNCLDVVTGKVKLPRQDE